MSPNGRSKAEEGGASALAGGATAVKHRRAVLDPVDRCSEIVFGIIMAMTFTGSIQVAAQGRGEIRTLLVGAIGCNIAWGLVDAVMYLLTTIVQRNRAYNLQREVARLAGSSQARRLLADELPERLAAVLAPAELDAIGRWVGRQAPPPARARLGASDLRAAFAIFLLVSLTTVPLVLPFVLLDEPVRALRSSHGIAVLILFACGFTLGKHSGQRAPVTGVAMASIGLVLVLLTIFLGG